MKLHCLFEQSGTFKNEFKKLTGGMAFDYDILNQFGETDYQIDLFKEIENAYEEKPSVFDSIEKDDFVLAFFPCTKFQEKLAVNARGENFGMKDWSVEKKTIHSLKMMNPSVSI